jgi:hypothetical protein
MSNFYHLKNGTAWRGKTHRCKNDEIHTGEKHSDASKKLHLLSELPNSIQDSVRKRAKKA